MYHGDLIKKYVSKGNKQKKLIFSLRDWCALQSPNIPLTDAFECLCKFSRDNGLDLDDVVTQMVSKEKTYGRSSVVFGNDAHGMTMRYGDDGMLSVFGYNDKWSPQKKGQHRSVDNDRIFTKGSVVNKNYQKSVERIKDLGQMVRNEFPNANKMFIENVIVAIKKFAAEKKISESKVMDGLKSGRYKMDMNGNGGDFVITTNKKRIKLSESQISDIDENTRLTEYKFYNNVQRFLSDLLRDPVHAKVSFVLSSNGIDRNRLLRYLKKHGIITRTHKICDKDNEGNPKTAVMKIKYGVPRKDFAKKMKKLFIDLVARTKPLNEDGEGGAECVGATGAENSGQFSQPLFSEPIRRKMPTDESTTTSTVGDIEYDAPVLGDKETLSRHNGEGGSVSVNICEYLDNRMIGARDRIKNSKDDYGDKWAESPYGDNKEEIIHNQWMIHFSEQSRAKNIKNNGFSVGNSYNEEPREKEYN